MTTDGPCVNPYRPGMRIKFKDFDKTYRIMDWKSMSGTLDLLYGPCWLVTTDDEKHDHAQLFIEKGVLGFAVEEQCGCIVPLTGGEPYEVLEEPK